jgi:flagellin
MGLVINGSGASLAAARSVSTQNARAEHAERAIASGNRIVSAGDDAAGLAISENLRSQIAGGRMARSNAANAESLVQTSEGSLNEIGNILTRVRELGVQAASDTVGDDERKYAQLEAKQLVSEVDRIAKSTSFGSRKLLDGSGGELSFQVGAGSGDENQIDYDLKADATASSLGVKGLDISDRSGARSALDTIDTALQKVNEMRADYGAIQNRLSSTQNVLDAQDENFSAARSRIADADYAHESAESAAAQIQRQAAVGVLAQANQSGASALRLLQ